MGTPAPGAARTPDSWFRHGPVQVAFWMQDQARADVAQETAVWGIYHVDPSAAPALAVLRGVSAPRGAKRGSRRIFGKSTEHEGSHRSVNRGFGIHCECMQAAC